MVLGVKFCVVGGGGSRHAFVTVKRRCGLVSCSRLVGRSFLSVV